MNRGSWTEFSKGGVPLRFADGQTGIQKDYGLGPLSVTLGRVSAK